MLAAQSTAVVGTSDEQASDLTEFTRNLGVLAVNDIDYPMGCICASNPLAPQLPPLLDFPNTQMNAVEPMVALPGCRPVTGC